MGEKKVNIKTENQDYEHDTSKVVNLELQKITTNEKGDKQLNCSQCPYSTPQAHHMKSHIESVHMKIKKYQCRECGYASSRKNGLDRHWDALHNKGEKKFKCGRCTYSSAESSKLKKHIARVHDTISTMPMNG